MQSNLSFKQKYVEPLVTDTTYLGTEHGDIKILRFF